MASSAHSEVALLSIHPYFAAAILRGQKTVEFRKRPFARPVERVVIYATAPVQRIVGTFDVEGIDVDDPRLLWARYATVGCIDKNAFDTYYASSATGAAIRIKGSCATSVRLPLAILGDVHPPQSYRYLEPDALRRLTKSSARPRTQVTVRALYLAGRLLRRRCDHADWAVPGEVLPLVPSGSRLAR